MFRPLFEGGYALGFFNMGDKDQMVPVYLEQLGIPLYSGYGLELTDVFTGEVLKPQQEIMMPKTSAHGCVVYRGRLVKAG